ncbi:MAG TPA: hypothetical protein VI749_04180 [Candidatus Omnitrophota bacterium]|nr:hypothetical protein [Candidatus Omnitrophota bacterium]
MGLAFLLGLQNAMNPFALATALVYVTILSIVRHSRFQLIISGLIFITVAWLINFFVLSGIFDGLIYRSFMKLLVIGLYTALAGLFFVLGFAHLRYRWQEQTGKDKAALRLPSPRTLTADAQTRSLKNTAFLLLLCVFSAAVLSLVEGRLTQNYYLFILLSQQLQLSAGWLKVFGVYLSYILAYTIILVAFWLFCIGSSLMRPALSNATGYLERAIYAAIYLAVGFGLIYYLLRVVQF